ncbi:MAG: hexameric tyrosine-coordinated heme protein [Desulfobulbia bacterium]
MSIYDEVLPTLITKTPAEGRELAILIARKTIAAIQPDAEVRQKLRPDYAEDSAKLMQAGHAVAVEFQTIAAANNYWRE